MRSGRAPRYGWSGRQDRDRRYGRSAESTRGACGGASGALGSDKLVDAGAQVVQLKILLGRRLAVVDLLGPLLERHLDSERLVDRERDVEKIQAVDAEVVDGVAFRLDRLARNIAGLRDDIGHGVKGRRHQ